jgi:hypothetical protein
MPRWICWGLPTRSTPVYIDGVVQGGSLKGNVYIQGQGDPKLVLERLWLLLRRLQAQGVQVIVGDIVLDAVRSPCLHTTPDALTASRCAPTTRRRMRCCSTTSRWS